MISIHKSSEGSNQRTLRNTIITLSFIIGLLSVRFNTAGYGYLNENQLQSDQETWQQCIYDIQEHTMSSLSDVFSRPELKHPSTPPLLYIDPAYGENAGDNFIVYGSLVFMEKMGFLNHTECNVYASQGFSPSCGNFSHFEEGGLAVWHGGGNWGDIWGRDVLQLKRLKSVVTLAHKGKIIVGFPQSLHYNNKNLEAQDASEFMGNFINSSHAALKKNVILTWRQEDSLAKAKRLYPLVGSRYLLLYRIAKNKK